MGRLIIESKAACKGKEAMIGRDEIFRYVRKNITSQIAISIRILLQMKSAAVCRSSDRGSLSPAGVKRLNGSE